MKSLRELRAELTGVRLRATNVSMWYQGATLTEAARNALNESIQTYDFRIKRTYHSLVLPDSGHLTHVLPKDVMNVLGVYAKTSTVGDRRRKLIGYKFSPTQDTKFLHIDALTYEGARAGEVEYESRLTEIPAEMAVGATFITSDLSVQVTGGVPVAQYRAPGYIEITPLADTTQREIVRYAAVTPTHFTGLERNYGGEQTLLFNHSIGAKISPVVEVPNEALPTIMHGASAEMYHFWVRNRALYDEYTAIASVQQMDLGDLLGLIRTEEDRADRRYVRAHKGPEPTHAHRKRVRR